MILHIHRCGSGWGGAVGHWEVNVEKRIAINLTNDKAAPVHLPDISLLLLLENCGITPPSGCSYFDIQQDYVHIVNSDGTETTVWDSDNDVYPENPALQAKLQGLIDYLPCHH